VDRTAVITANAETMVVRPPGIQEAINAEAGNNILLITGLNKTDMILLILGHAS